MSGSRIHASKTCLFISVSISIIILNNAHANDLITIYSQAEVNNIKLRSAITDYRIIKESRNEIAAEYGSSLSFNAKPGLNFSTIDESNNLGIDYSFAFTKPIYQRQLNARLSQAEASIQRERASLQLQKQQLIARVTKAYLQVISAQNRLAFSLSEQDIIRQKLRKLKTLFRSQLVVASEVSEIELLLEQSIVKASLASVELSTTRKELELETGYAHGQLADLDHHKDLPQLHPNELSAWINLANQHSADLLMARFDLHIQRADIQIQEAEESTSIDLFASYDGETGTANNQRSNKSGGKVGLEFNVPLYSGDRNASKIRSAKLQQQKTRHALDLKMREISQAIQLAFLTVQVGTKNVQILKNSVWVSSNALSNSKTARAAGISTEMDVLSALADSLKFKREYAEAKYTLLKNLVDLKLATGTLSVDDLLLINSLLTSAQYLPKQLDSLESTFNDAEDQGLTLESAWGID